MIVLAGLLTQALASHNFIRADYYTAAALATSCLSIAMRATGSASRADIAGAVQVEAVR